MAFDPSEPRDPHSGKWIKIAKALKGFQQGGYHYDSGSTHEKIVRSALQELPKGGKGNLIKLNGVEIRRHQTGSFNVKINGEARHYTNHEDAAAAVVAKKHNVGGTLKAGGHATTPVGQAASSKPKFVLSDDMQTLKDQAKKLEEILAHKSLSAKLSGKGAPNDPATKKQDLHLQAIYDKMAQIQQTKPSVSAPKTPYKDANHLMVKKGDVVKLNGQHWQVTGKTSVTGNPSAKELHLQNAQGGTTTKILSGSATIEKSNTPEKFVPYVGPKAHAVPAYDPAKELPAGALKGPQAWSAIPQYSPKTQEERKAIKGYTNGEYGSMNAGLRKGLMTAQVEKLVEGLDAAFKHPTILTHEVVVHRGFSNQDSILGNLGSHIGGVFIDHGFISTSTNEDTASSFGGGAIVDIILPKGAGVLKAGTNSSHQSESEIILNRGSKFRIISDKMVSTGGVYGGQKRRVVVRLVV